MVLEGFELSTDHASIRAGLRDVYQLELATYPLIDRMARIGIKPDLAHFAELSKLLQLEIDRLRVDLEGATERPGFNANSGDQVAEYLFGSLGLDEIKITRGGRGSTNDKILEALENEHPEYPVISDIRSYRETYKLKNTLSTASPTSSIGGPSTVGFMLRFGRQQWSLDVWRRRTLMYSPKPEHGVFAPYFKMGWVADEGHLICAWDESQIELRGLAHLSQDPVLCAVFVERLAILMALSSTCMRHSPNESSE